MSQPCDRASLSAGELLVLERHADEVQAENARESTRLAALQELQRACVARPLRVASDFFPRGAALATLAVKVRLDHARLDHAWLYGLLDQLGWCPAPNARNTLNARYDCRVIEHVATAAKLLLIITLPPSEPPEWEAA